MEVDQFREAFFNKGTLLLAHWCDLPSFTWVQQKYRGCSHISEEGYGLEIEHRQFNMTWSDSTSLIFII
jgi:hypothetical protein